MRGPVTRRLLGAAALAGLLVAAACSAEVADTSPGRTDLAVVTTTTQLTDVAKQVGGGRVTVYGVLKANIDPHDYEPSPGDISAMAKADVIVKNGVGLEAWFDDAVKSAAPKGRVVDASAGVTIRKGANQEEPKGDPHIWHNPQNVVTIARTMAAAMTKAAPAAAADIEANLAAYTAKLNALDAEVQRQIDGLTNKKLVTNHDAFGYYVDRYGLDFVGSIIPSFDTSAELSATQIAAIVAVIKATGTKAVFSESSLPPKTAEAIGREAGVKVVAGKDALYGDTLGPAGSEGATYLTMVEHNTKVIVDNLR